MGCAVLFADVAGSTRLYETAGDAVALTLIGRCIDVMKAVCEERDGRVVGFEALAFPMLLRLGCRLQAGYGQRCGRRRIRHGRRGR